MLEESRILNVNDLSSYQANPDFKPDKRNLWKIPPEKT
jgi:hypothetical protein